MAALKRISGIILCLLAFLLMSHNTYALDLTANVEFVESWENNSMTCAARYGQPGYFNSNTCAFGNVPAGGTGIATRGISYVATRNINMVAGDYYQFYITVSTADNAQTSIPVVWNWHTVSGNYSIVGITEVQSDNNLGSEAANEGYIKTYSVILRALQSNSSFPLQLGYNDYQTNFIYIVGNATTVYADIRITTINHFRAKTDDSSSVIDAINNQTQEEVDATQDAADASQSAGSSSTASAETATSSLISVIGGFVSAVTSAQPTNCRINANLNHINMGELDLCANPVPSYIQIIGSIILICAAIPLAIVLFNRFIGLFRSFQN